MSYQRLFIRCDLCSPRKRGYLWLGGGDWVECPQCNATGKVEVIEEHVTPRGKVFISGETGGATIADPRHARRFG